MQGYFIIFHYLIFSKLDFLDYRNNVLYRNYFCLNNLDINFLIVPPLLRGKILFIL